VKAGLGGSTELENRPAVTENVAMRQRFRRGPRNIAAPPEHDTTNAGGKSEKQKRLLWFQSSRVRRRLIIGLGRELRRAAFSPVGILVPTLRH
jgi:hypothetical protein